jgi:beta-glucosidase
MMPLYKRSTAPIEARVADLMAQMTLQDKLAELRGGLKGSSAVAGASVREAVERTNAAQRAAMAANRLAIPVLFHGDPSTGSGQAANGMATLPRGLALAATWDPALVREIYASIAREARAHGARLVPGPGLEIARDPRQGRVQGSFGEDPFLVSEMGVAAIEGLQGNGMPRLIAHDKVLAAAGHFAGEGPPAEGAAADAAPLSERELREVYLVAFEEAVRRTGIGAVVLARNDIDAVPSHANKWLLDDVLRGEWSYRGAVLGDPEGIADLHNVYRVAVNPADAATLAFEAGIDADLSDAETLGALAEAVRAGRIPLARIDAAVARLLELKFRAGLFEKPFAEAPEGAARTRDTRTRAVAAKAARRSITLLKNDGILPLAIPAGRVRPRIAVIELGESRVLEAIHTKLRGRAQFVSAHEAEYVILAIGDVDAQGSIDALKTIDKPLVVVLSGSRPAVSLDLAQRANGLLAAWGLGAHGASAIADVLFGEVNPGGKLPVTLARNPGQMPIFYDVKPSGKRGYLFDTTEPLYPFGWGLGYSSFELGAPRLSATTIGANGTVTVSVEIRNTGKRAGDETVQLYVRDKVSSVTRPVKQLKGFQRVTLGAGERRIVTFQLTPRSFWMWNDQMRRVVEPGDFEVMTGANSRQLQSTTLTVLARTNP